MSTAEFTAQRIFDSYRIKNLPDEVRRYLAILCIENSSSVENADADAVVALSDTEKRVRAQEAFADAKAGRIYTTEEICKNLDAKYPWLCE